MKWPFFGRNGFKLGALCFSYRLLKGIQPAAILALSLAASESLTLAVARPPRTPLARAAFVETHGFVHLRQAA